MGGKSGGRKVYVEVDRGGVIETRGVSGTDDEVREFVAHLARQYGVQRVLNEQGQDVTADYEGGKHDRGV